MVIQNYLDSAKKQFEYYKLLGEKTFQQISPADFFWKPNEESNSIAIIINHLHGNMLSRWTDFLSTDGEKDFRNRDAEFEIHSQDVIELILQWNEGWKTLFVALDSINETNFNNIIYIRNEGHSITDAINRQLSHYPYHVGQIVFIGKMICATKWSSLSIAKGASKSYNLEKFSIPPRKQHFTEEEFKKKSGV